MTDQNDELVSAYLDGQTTADESAIVESDPELVARVETLRELSDQLGSGDEPIDSVVRHRHLGAALAVFDELAATPGGLGVPSAGTAGASSAGTEVGGDGDGDTDDPPDANAAGVPIIDLAAGRARRDGQEARRTNRDTGHGSATNSHRPAPSRSRGIPAWLGAAAAVVVMAGGVGWFAATQQGGGSDDTATDAVATEAAEGQSVSADEESSGGDAGGDATEEAEAMLAQDSGEATTTAPEADAARLADDAGSEGGTAVTPSAGAAAPTTTAPAGPGPTIVVFDDVPSASELLVRRATVTLSPAGGSACAAEVDPPGNRELAGYFGVEVGGEPGEALVFDPVDGGPEGDGTVVVLVTARCDEYSS